jgi:hypothetical protein
LRYLHVLILGHRRRPGSRGYDDGRSYTENQASTNARHWVEELQAGRIDRANFNQIVIDHADMGDEYRAEPTPNWRGSASTPPQAGCTSDAPGRLTKRRDRPTFLDSWGGFGTLEDSIRGGDIR